MFVLFCFNTDWLLARETNSYKAEQTNWNSDQELNTW